MGLVAIPWVSCWFSHQPSEWADIQWHTTDIPTTSSHGTEFIPVPFQWSTCFALQRRALQAEPRWFRFRWFRFQRLRDATWTLNVRKLHMPFNVCGSASQYGKHALRTDLAFVHFVSCWPAHTHTKIPRPKHNLHFGIPACGEAGFSSRNWRTISTFQIFRVAKIPELLLTPHQTCWILLEISCPIFFSHAFNHVLSKHNLWQLETSLELHGCQPSLWGSGQM